MASLKPLPLTRDDFLLKPQQLVIALEGKFGVAAHLGSCMNVGLCEWLDLLELRRTDPALAEDLQALAAAGKTCHKGTLRVECAGISISGNVRWRIDHVLAELRGGLSVPGDGKKPVRQVVKDGAKWIAIQDGDRLGSYDTEGEARSRLAWQDRYISMQFDVSLEEMRETDTAHVSSNALLHLDSRDKAMAVHSAIASAEDPSTSYRAWGTISVTDLPNPGKFPVRITTCRDALDGLVLRPADGTTIRRERQNIDGVPVLVEHRRLDDAVSRTWIALTADVTDELGNVDLARVKRLLEPYVQRCQQPVVSECGSFIMVTDS